MHMQPTYMYGSLPSAKLYALRLGQKDKIMIYLQSSLIAQLVNNLPAMQETQVWFLCVCVNTQRENITHTHRHHYDFFFFFFFDIATACGILVPSPGIKPMPPCGGSPWATREFSAGTMSAGYHKN